jgi:hypothetical protein
MRTAEYPSKPSNTSAMIACRPSVERVSDKLDDAVGTLGRDVLQMVPTVLHRGRLRP